MHSIADITMTLETLNTAIQTELNLTISQHQLAEATQKQALDDWLAANRVAVLAALDQLANMSVNPLQTKILAGDCTLIGLQKQYEITLTINDADLRTILDSALECHKCLRLLVLLCEYNESHPENLLYMGGLRRISPDQNDYLLYFATRQ